MKDRLIRRRVEITEEQEIAGQMLVENLAEWWSCLGGAFKCDVCGKEFPADRDAIRDYFYYGWPFCCGKFAVWYDKKGRKVF